MALQAYFDESGTHLNDPTTVSVGGFVSSVDAWEHFNSEWKRALDDWADSLLGGPYGFAAAACLLKIGKIFRSVGTNELIATMFEKGATGYGQVATSHANMTRNDTFTEYTRLGVFAGADKRIATPLQAADIVAYELHRAGASQLGLDPRDRRPFPLGFLAAHLPYEWGYYGAAEISRWSQALSTDFSGGLLDFDTGRAYLADGREYTNHGR